VLALIISYVLVTYLFIPSALFRFRPRTILKKFQRTRVEELTFAVEVSVIPWTLTFLLAYVANCFGYLVKAEWADYREILAASYSEEFFRTTQTQFWSSLRAVRHDQFSFVVVACILAYVEGYVFSHLIQNYWKRRKGTLSRLLIGNVSEWYMLLSTVSFPPNPEHRVAADILCSEDHLYKGFVGNYFLDTDGELSGLLLTEPQRFDRQGYLKAGETTVGVAPESFWHDIPGANLYIPRDRIVNINLRYPLADETEAAVVAAANVELQQVGSKFEVVAEDGADDKKQKRE
jgi:hypothetical protein